MNTLTLNQLKTILCQQSDVNLAAELLRSMGFDVTESPVGFHTYHFDFEPYSFIFRDDKHSGGFSFVILERFNLKERQAFLALQQEPAVKVPATAPVVGLPELTVYCPSCDFSGATATQHAPDSPDHHITCSNCGFDADRNKITLVS